MLTSLFLKWLFVSHQVFILVQAWQCTTIGKNEDSGYIYWEDFGEQGNISLLYLHFEAVMHLLRWAFTSFLSSHCCHLIFLRIDMNVSGFYFRKWFSWAFILNLMVMWSETVTFSHQSWFQGMLFIWEIAFSLCCIFHFTLSAVSDTWPSNDSSTLCFFFFTKYLNLRLGHITKFLSLITYLVPIDSW